MSAGVPEVEAAQVTLNTIRDWAQNATATPGGNDHGRGYESAARDVLAILAMHGRPPGEPVIFGAS